MTQRREHLSRRYKTRFLGRRARARARAALRAGLHTRARACAPIDVAAATRAKARRGSKHRYARLHGEIDISAHANETEGEVKLTPLPPRLGKIDEGSCAHIGTACTGFQSGFYTCFRDAVCNAVDDPMEELDSCDFFQDQDSSSLVGSSMALQKCVLTVVKPGV